ncbi:tyrosine-type recombinase/integrase [Micrococcus luteus]
MRLRDPSNTQRELRDVRDTLGYSKLATHSFRKTAATMLGRAGMSAIEVAAFLGHANPSMTQDVYLNTLKGDTRAGVIMEEQLAGVI